jgi:hypothetical protein
MTRAFAQAPVLAKRKTKLMKELEIEKQEKAQKREKAAKKAEDGVGQPYIPNHTDVDAEKNLRRIATRGGEVVACATGWQSR